MFCDFTEFGMNFTDRRPPATRRMKCRSGFRALGHFPKPASHQRFMSQVLKN
ncbi:hypothetical protein HAX54_002159, partial [Datura stramonium]|nr:hypothetical protein [Datura stramonium]